MEQYVVTIRWWNREGTQYTDKTHAIIARTEQEARERVTDKLENKISWGIVSVKKLEK